MLGMGLKKYTPPVYMETDMKQRLGTIPPPVKPVAMSKEPVKAAPPKPSPALVPLKR